MINTNKTEDVLRFISRFTDNGKRSEVLETFKYGCCYWFAQVLCERFKAKMMYDPVQNHFAAAIDDRLYDISGDVTDDMNAVVWNDYDDEPHKQRIIKYCVDF